MNKKSLPGKLEWSKKLYIKTDHPDNYIDPTFLNLKKTNG